MKCVFLFVLVLLLSSCNKSNKFNEKDEVDIQASLNVGKSKLEFQTISPLTENLDIMKDITSFSMLNNDYFIITTTDRSVYLYDSSGIQIRKLGAYGPGPKEYIKPSIIKCFGEYLYVWCSGSSKLLKMDISGEVIDEYTGFRKAVSNFVVKDNLVFFYISGGHDTLIEEYDLDSKEKLREIGLPTNEHKLLSFFAYLYK